MAEWQKLDGEKGLVPDFIAQYKPQVDAIFQTINLTLDLLQNILNFVKNFLIDFTQPIKLIIDALIAQLKALLQDIKNLGLYWTDDSNLIPQIKESGLASFQGGYGAFENRMVRKLTNVSDPTRPNFSTATGTMSLFVVAVGDITTIVAAINAIMNVVKLLTNTFSPSADPDPVNIKGEITNGFLPVNIKDSIAYDGVKITWDIAPPPNASGKAFPSYVKPPKSFLVHVRTRPTAWYIGYKYRPNNKSNTEEQDKTSLYKIGNDLATVNGSVALYKNGDKVFYLDDINSDIEYKKEHIEETGKTFYYSPSALGSFFAGSSYSLKIDIGKLPKTYEYKYKNDGGKKIVDTQTEVPTTKLFIEVVSCDTDLGLSDGDNVKDIYDLPSDTKPNLSATSTKKLTQVRDRANLSLPLPETKDYLTALKNALAIYFLGAYFLDDTMELTTETQANIRAYLSKSLGDYELNPKDAKLFRNLIAFKIGVIVNKMNIPPQNVIKSLEKDIKNLIGDYIDPDPRKIGSKTSLYSLMSDLDSVAGVSLNSNYFLGNLASGFADKRQELWKSIYPEDKLPVIYYADASKPNTFEATQIGELNKAETVRDLIERTKSAENTPLKVSAKNILSLLPLRKTPGGNGDWKNIKFFEDGIPGFEDFFKTIIGFLESFSLGLDGIIKAIKQYIDLIVLRIEELQVLINKIKAIIDLLFNLKISGNLSLLFNAENEGTSGIVNNLTTSLNKPEGSGNGSFAFGACFVFGGYPAFLPALFKALSGE